MQLFREFHTLLPFFQKKMLTQPTNKNRRLGGRLRYTNVYGHIDLERCSITAGIIVRNSDNKKKTTRTRKTQNINRNREAMYGTKVKQ